MGVAMQTIADAIDQMIMAIRKDRDRVFAIGLVGYFIDGPPLHGRHARYRCE